MHKRHAATQQPATGVCSFDDEPTYMKGLRPKRLVAARTEPSICVGAKALQQPCNRAAPTRRTLGKAVMVVCFVPSFVVLRCGTELEQLPPPPPSKPWFDFVSVIAMVGR